MKIRMKPETIARRAAKRAADREQIRVARHARLRELIERDGPNSIWAEMLATEEADK